MKGWRLVFKDKSYEARTDVDKQKPNINKVYYMFKGIIKRCDVKGAVIVSTEINTSKGKRLPFDNSFHIEESQSLWKIYKVN